MGESDRTKLTFRQAEGLEPLPGPLRLGEVSQEARSLIWSVLYASLRRKVIQPARLSTQYAKVGWEWSGILEAWRVKRLHLPVDEFDPLVSSAVAYVKKATFHWPYDMLFEFITFVIRSEYQPDGLSAELASTFVESRLAYRIDGQTIYPVSSEEEAEVVLRAFADLRVAEHNGAYAHLRDAGAFLAVGDYAAGVRESINAVESVARAIEPRANTLADAMRKLAASNRINPNFKRGVEALYAYAGDEPGVRHALVFDAQPNVDATDAIYMFGACAAFVSFLIAKAAASPR